MALGFIVKLESKGLTDELTVECERKREVMGDSKVFG